MAKREDRQAAHFPPFGGLDFGKFTSLGGLGHASLARTGNAFARAVGELGSEITEFTRQRLDSAIAVSQSLSLCKSIEEAAARQMDFVRTETRAYLDEAHKLVDMTGKVAAEGLKALEDFQSTGNARQRVGSSTA
jgi:hypothetical protein